MTDSGRKPERDELYGDVCKFAESNKIVTPSLLQRNFRIGYGRAILLIEQMEEANLIERIEQEKFNSFKWQWKAMTRKHQLLAGAVRIPRGKVADKERMESHFINSGLLLDVGEGMGRLTGCSGKDSGHMGLGERLCSSPRGLLFLMLGEWGNGKEDDGTYKRRIEAVCDNRN